MRTIPKPVTRNEWLLAAAVTEKWLDEYADEPVIYPDDIQPSTMSIDDLKECPT